MNDSPNDYKELYNQFKRDLKDQPLEMYYDEDEIIMVFDQAGDYSDTHTQINALMLGYRLYPGSEALLVRQGLFLLNNSMFNTATLDYYLQCNSGRKGLMWDIIRLRTKSQIPEEVDDDKLSKLIEEYTFEEDEEIIQFANLIDQSLSHDWLAEHYNEFIARCRYKDTALSECMRVLRVNHGEIAIQLGEELTRIDPFNHDSWTKLAEVNRDMNRIDDGLAAIEYAKALAPDDYMQQFVEAQLLASRQPDSPEAIALLKKVIEVAPGMIEAKYVLSEIYSNAGRNDLATMLWNDEMTDSDPTVSRIYSPGTDADYAVPEGCHTEEELENTLQQLSEESPQNSQLATISLMSAFDKAHGLYRLAGDYIKLLYDNMMLDEIIDFMERERSEDSPEMRFEAYSIPLYAATLLRLGRYDDAARVAREYMLNASRLCTSTQLRLTFAGVKIALAYIIEKALGREYSRDRDPIAECFS
ncbi:MAG: hypothetical protein K2M68_02675 [Muribaculaceae bacterium]|nr:hypothetical protein [Muribaculaceae bacterium]